MVQLGVLILVASADNVDYGAVGGVKLGVVLTRSFDIRARRVPLEVVLTGNVGVITVGLVLQVVFGDSFLFGAQLRTGTVRTVMGLAVLTKLVGITRTVGGEELGVILTRGVGTVGRVQPLILGELALVGTRVVRVVTVGLV